MWQRVRIAFLLLVLVTVAAGAWIDRTVTTSWERPLVVGVYPIAADDTPAVNSYLDSLDEAQFQAISGFFAREAKAYGLALDRPIGITLQPRLEQLPPRLPSGAGMLRTAWWSLRMRWYAWRATSEHPAQIRLFVLYHDPDDSPTVPPSLGLQKGLIGVVYAFADAHMDGANNIVIAHELLHTLGATDKYDVATLLPSYPDGFGDPDASPRYPQSDAEVMAGRRAVTRDTAEMPRSLEQVVIGERTASEIRWLVP